MDRSGFQQWLDRYVEAWQSYDRTAIEALFARDAEYRYHPWDEPVRGRDRIADGWLEDRDEPGSWRATYRAIAVDGSDAVATGTSEYLTEDGTGVDRVYHNAFVCRFDGEGRCASFTEFYMEQPKAETT